MLAALRRRKYDHVDFFIEIPMTLCLQVPVDENTILNLYTVLGMLMGISGADA